jgi:hypothetical protein
MAELTGIPADTLELILGKMGTAPVSPVPFARSREWIS